MNGKTHRTGLPRSFRHAPESARNDCVFASFLSKSFVVLLFVPTLAILFQACGRKPQEQAVATVGSHRVGIAHYLDRYGEFLRSTGLNDNLQVRHMFLQTLIDEHLFLEWADTTGMAHHPVHRTAMEELDHQILLNKLYQHDIRSRVVSSEEELRTLYRWSKTRIHARHLYARREDQAQRLYRRLADGETWDDLASEAFQDSVLAANGGDLGFFEMGEMDPAFEAMAFQLNHGEISPPVKTALGYSIIQVVEKEIDPFLTEDEFRLKMPWLKEMALAYRNRPAVESYTDSIGTELNIHFVEPGISRVWDQREKITSMSSDEIVIQDAHQPCVRFGDARESWTVRDALLKLQRLSWRQKKRITSEVDLEQVVAGLIIQDRLLAEARHLGLDTTRVFKTESRGAQRGYLMSRIIQFITDPVQDPQDRRKAFVEFRDSLKQRASISIDSALIKELVLN